MVKIQIVLILLLLNTWSSALYSNPFDICLIPHIIERFLFYYSCPSFLYSIFYTCLHGFNTTFLVMITVSIEIFYKKTVIIFNTLNF